MWGVVQCNVMEDWPREAKVIDGEYFDFIIVGAGSAGSVVANRLSENKDWSVLLIEAGGDPPIESAMPYFWSQFMKPSTFNWNLTTVNMPDIGKAFKSGSAYHYPQGKMLGGSGSTNGMIYYKGLDYNYQQWYDLGNEEWHPSVTQQYSKKAECLQDEVLLNNSGVAENFGKNGPVPINTFKNRRGNTLDILSAFEEIGIKTVDELNSANLMGAGIYTSNVANGKRQSTAKAYLVPGQNRVNLKILKNTLVTKVLIDDESKKAYGVEVERQGMTQKFYSNLEVIVRAGAFNTPKLLMLSGVGPQDGLESHKIPCIVNSLGVGQNLQDHSFVLVTIYADEPTIDNLEEAFSTMQYLYDSSGKLSESFATNVNAFYPLNKDSVQPDLQAVLEIYPKNAVEVQEMAAGYETSVEESILAHAANHALYLFNVVSLQPFSKGYVSLKSDDPREPPIINPKYLSDSRDLDNCAAGCQVIANLANSTYFKSINGYLRRMEFELCNDFELNSLDYWKCISKSTVQPGLHPVGTAKMGPRSDPYAVVDSRLRVYGVEGLRVVDASVIPIVPSCNTNGPTIMVAERASDLIKEDHKKWYSKW